jgi:macrolide transport system ATP-binding/permease protein
MMRSFIRKLIWLAQRRRKEAELRAELEFHLDEEAEERQAEGSTLQQARWAAHRDLGNLTLLQENIRAVWISTFWEQFLQDVRYALRMMAANKTFSALAILSLALGIGANAAIYSFMDSLLQRALPVPDPGSLAVLNWHPQARVEPGQRMSQLVPVVQAMSGHFDDDPQWGLVAGIFPFPAFELLQENSASVFSSLFAYRSAGIMNLTIKGEAGLASGEYVSGDYFHGLSVAPAAGRLIIPDDDRTGAPPVVVISWALSQRRFGGATNATGQPILINNRPVTVVGVTPPEFFGVDPAAAPDFYLPMHANLLVQDPGRCCPAQAYLEPHLYWIEMMGRLRPGVSQVQAQAALAPVFQQWVASTATTYRERANLPALVIQEGAGGLYTLRRQYSKPLYVLLTLVGLILAIACANVANLLLARATARRGEMALRLSLGAGRLRLVRQLLTESVLLASLGGVLGVLFAIWGIRFLTLLLANGRADFTLHANLNWHVLGATAALSLLTGVLFGLAPALQATRVDVVPALKQLRTTEARTRVPVRLNQVLVVFQIALSLLLLVAAGLFVRTLVNLQSVELGFNRENVLLFRLNARQAGHQDPEIIAFYTELQRRFSLIPGVRNATLSNSSLIHAGLGFPISVHGASPRVRGAQPDEATRILTVGPEFFKTMQIPILAGREIEEHDQTGSLPVAVVSELFAKANFGDQNPLGQHLDMTGGPTPRDMEIVGVSKNARYGGLKHVIPPVVYIPYNQGFPQPREMVYALRTAGDPLAYVKTVREIVRQADARVPLSDVRTQVVDIDQTINQEITFAKLCTAFAALALTIACVGLYGTMSYKVARRTGEIGIRMALGAQRGAVVWMVLREVLVLAAVGLLTSVPLTLATSKLIESFLFGMKPNDPLALSLAVTILVSAALVAGYLPARKASRIDPMIALRHE